MSDAPDLMAALKASLAGCPQPERGRASQTTRVALPPIECPACGELVEAADTGRHGLMHRGEIKG